MDGPFSFQNATNSATIGSHIATGSYQGRLASLCPKYPNIRYPNLQFPWANDYKPPAGIEKLGKVAVLKFEDKQTPKRTDIIVSQDLHNFLQEASNATDSGTARRLYLVEAWDSEMIGILGEHFQINPTLLVRQYRSGMWEKTHQSGNTPCLLSTFDPKQSFSIPYYEPRFFLPHVAELQGQSWRAAENFCHISLSRILGQFDGVGIVHRKVSYWSRRTGGGGWDALLFLDPPVRDVFIGSRQEARQVSMPGEPYQGGYPDFMRYKDLNDTCSSPGPSRESMLEDLSYYWTQYAKDILVEDDPIIATFFLKKIIASNYLLLIGYIGALLSELDYDVSRRDRPISRLQIEWVEERWKDLQAWTRQCSKYCESVEEMMYSFEIPTESEVSKSWETGGNDFYIIQRKLLSMSNRSNDLLASFTGLAGILGNRKALKEANRSLHEAKSVKTLTFLGMLFLPLSLASGLLSMSGDYSPGASQFWIYFAIAIPLILCVFGVVFLVKMGYGVDGEWSLRHWKNSVAAFMTTMGTSGGSTQST